jgi:hypothetical protein
VFRVAFAAPPSATFTRKPTATKTAAGVKIEFAVSAPTDVAVYVEDAAGKVVCHLAAGVLGKNPPPPLKPDSLEQSILWDGRDDFGRPALGGQGEPRGPLKIRVALGMKGELDRFVLHNPDGSGRAHALAVGPNGTIYVFHAENTANDNMGGHKIKVYSRDGKHLRVLVPFPADIAPERVRALGVFQTAEGDLVPRVHNWETLSFYPDTVGGRGRSMPDAASCPAVDSKGRVYWLVRGPVLCAVDADGGVPYDRFLGPRLLGEIKGLKLAGELYEYWREKPALAVSSDDRYVYFAGLSAASGPLPCVFRVSAETRGPAEVFVGKLATAGKQRNLLTAPRGLAVAKGLLYVADPEADRIAVFREADRSFVADIKIENPQCVGADPATGAVYVCSYTGKQTADLVKFSGLADGRELYRLVLPRTGMSPNPGQHRIAVDASRRPVRIWMPELMYAPWSLKCFEDTGEKFVDKGDPRSQDRWIEGPRDLSLDRVRGELYVKGNYGKMNGQKFWRLDQRTCEVLKDFDPKIGSTASGTQLVPGADGNLYTLSFGAGLVRFTREVRPLNWEGHKTHVLPVGGVMNFQQRYLALRPYAPVDELYVVGPPFYRLMLEQGMTWDDAAKKSRAHMARRYTSLNVIGLDGKTRRTVIWQCLDSAVPRLDRWGNIYLADMVKPPGRSYPEFFDGKLPDPAAIARKSDRLWTSAMYASIIKFPPSGGAIWFDKKHRLALSCVGSPSAELLARPKVPFRTQYGREAHLTGELQGALWYRFGYSPYSIPGSGGMCNCEGSGFDVDPFGRVFYPNLGQFRVEVIDTNNNPITTFGKYGNEDSGGKGARVKKPEIPLAWPTYVAVSDNHAYVADTVNRRVVRVKLAYAAEQTCPIR